MIPTSNVKTYPSFECVINVPQTKELIKQAFLNNPYSCPRIKVSDRKARLKVYDSFIKTRIGQYERNGENISQVNFKLHSAFVTNTWKCDIENNQEVKKQLEAKGRLNILYSIKSFNAGLTIGSLHCKSGNKSYVANSFYATLYSYQSPGILLFKETLSSSFSLKSMPDVVDITGLSLNLWTNFNNNQSYETEVSIDKLWENKGKKIAEKQLKKYRIQFNFTGINFEKNSKKTKLYFDIKKRHDCRMRLAITQGKKVFYYPKLHNYSYHDGNEKIVWRGDFNLQKPAKLTIYFRSWIPISNKKYKFKKFNVKD